MDRHIFQEIGTTVSHQVSGTYPSTLRTTLTETLKSPGHQSNPSSRQRDRASVTFQNSANVLRARAPIVVLLSMKYSSVLRRAGRSCGRGTPSALGYSAPYDPAERHQGKPGQNVVDDMIGVPPPFVVFDRSSTVYLLQGLSQGSLLLVSFTCISPLHGRPSAR